MKNIFLLLYIVSILLLIYACFRMIYNKEKDALILGLCLIFSMSPDFMMFDYWGIHVSYIFVFIFAYVIPIWFISSNRKIDFKIRKQDNILWWLLLLLLAYALVTPVIHDPISDYYTSKLALYIYSVLVYMLIVCVLGKEFVSEFDKYSDIIIIAILAYTFKNFYMVGVEDFRYIYETTYEDYKNAIFASRTLGIGVIISSYMFLCTNRIKYLIAIITIAVQMIMFESRGPILAVFTAGFLCWIINKIKNGLFNIKISFNLKKTAALLIVFFVISYIIFFMYNSGALNRFAYKYAYYSMGIKEARDYLYSDCLDIILSTFPCGIGFGNTYITLLKYGSVALYNYPHNIVLELFMEDGALIGGIFLILIVLYIFKCLCGCVKKKKILFTALFIFSLVNSMFSGDVISNVGVFVFGTLVSRADIEKSSTSKI